MGTGNQKLIDRTVRFVHKTPTGTLTELTNLVTEGIRSDYWLKYDGQYSRTNINLSLSSHEKTLNLRSSKFHRD